VLVDSYSTLGVLQQTGVLLGNGDGTFGTFINILNNGAISPYPSIQIADMNGDSLPDVVFPYPSYQGFAVLLNTTPAVSADFTIGVASGSPTSQTVNAGQTASFSLVVVPSGSFSGTVNLSCAVTPAGATAPTCSLSSSALQIGSSGAQPVTVKVAATGTTAAAAFPAGFRPGTMPLALSLMLLVSAWLWIRSRKRLPVLGVPAIVLALAFCASCSGGSSSSARGTSYTVTVTATSGSVSHNMALQMVVQ
jgi:hypothetical protein